ncbi:unnamed protein product [Leptidea sinapis]|uniref:Uncharacterized protein n=1 Tax=Leptidea sinapis TaxID=189913 RepID=A0A5E4R8M8_9NEOP|nr:unnamed protein product [Leptidea sinapis]
MDSICFGIINFFLIDRLLGCICRSTTDLLR